MTVKSLAVRLDEDLHARLTAIANLEGVSITESIRSAIEAYITAKKTDPELLAKADTALAEIDREATTRREAIADLFGDPAASTETPAKARAKKTPSRGASADS